MPTVEEYKIGILRQLAELTVQGREPVLPLRFEIQGIIVFEDDLRACLLTEYGKRIVDRVIAELEVKQEAKVKRQRVGNLPPPKPLRSPPLADTRLATIEIAPAVDIKRSETTLIHRVMHSLSTGCW